MADDPGRGPGISLGPIRFDPGVVGASLALGALAVGLIWLLRDVLLTAPEAVFPLLLTVLIGGMLVVAWLRRG